jgi:hypothetical protein
MVTPTTTMIMMGVERSESNSGFGENDSCDRTTDYWLLANGTRVD